MSPPVASPRPPRRTFLRTALSGFFGFASLHGYLPALASLATAASPARRCLVLWMQGGPSQFETFDPKPGTRQGGPTGTVSTAVPGLHIAQSLPQIAQRMDRLAVLRSLSSPEGEHERAQYLMHTGYRQVPAFPRPDLGSLIAHRQGTVEFPRYVTIGGRGFGPAFLGPDFGPFSIEEPEDALQLLRQVGRRRDRLALLQNLSVDFDAFHPDKNVERRSSLIDRIGSLTQTPFVEALDMQREPARVQARYGREPFGQRLLLARRLLERNVNFVEVRLDGWDTHSDNFAATGRLCQQLDGPWATLLDDLQAGGLLDETLIVWMGEFGRTPTINAARGRDHYPQATPVVFGGGPIAGGAVVGSTSHDGREVRDAPCGVADVMATILSALGIEPDREYTTAFGSPTRATDNGTVIDDLLA